MKGIIDFHAHAFPDQIAAGAIPYLEEEGDIKAMHDGRIASLLDLMDRDGVEKSVICSIATRPSQFEAILSWSKQVRTERIIPFPSFTKKQFIPVTEIQYCTELNRISRVHYSSGVASAYCTTSSLSRGLEV